MPKEVMASGNADIDGVLWGYKWSSTYLTYSFPSSTAAWSYAKGIQNFDALSGTQIAAATRALKNADNVSGLVLKKAAAAGSSDLRFGTADRIHYQDGIGWHTPGFGSSAEGIPPDPAFVPYTHGHVWLSKALFSNPRPGTYAYASGFLHELGHALGLKHGQEEQDAHFVTFPKLPLAHDSQEYSVMTYNNYPGHQASRMTAPLDFPTTYMQADIAALQHMYGADYGFRAGNTRYAWDAHTGRMFVNGLGQDSPIRNKIFMTVWDGGGVDTFDFSNYHSAVAVNLSPGQWSTPSAVQKAYLGDGHYARGSIATALLHKGDARGLIENAVGGSGNDIMTGNDVRNVLDGRDGHDTLRGGKGADVLCGRAGRDVLVGGAGNDELRGGPGADQFVFFSQGRGTIGRDRITDFDPSQDRIVLDDALFAGVGRPGQAIARSSFFSGASAHDASDRLIYDPATGSLSWDADGSGAGGKMVFVLLGKHIALTAADFLII